MTQKSEDRLRSGWATSWPVVPGLVAGFVLTEFRPMLGLWLGMVSGCAAVVSLLWPRLPRWLAWLALGLAVGVGALYLMAGVQLLNPTPGSGSGSSSAR